MAKYQMEVLNALDLAKPQSYHFTAIVIAGMGFFTDAYDLFCISTVTKLLGRIYYFDSTSESPGSVLATVNGVALCGALAGQLFFGWMGDKMGRKKAYGITLMIMVITSIASGLSFGSTAKSVMTTLCFFRFWLGFGNGGDYPLSATIMSEYANKKTGGAFIAAVFAMQGLGILAAAGGVVAIIVSALQEKRHFSLTLAPLFVKDLGNPQFSNSGAKVVIMWGYASGANIYGAKVVFVKKLFLVLNEYVAFHVVWCKPPKPILGGLKFCGAKHQNQSNMD